MFKKLIKLLAFSSAIFKTSYASSNDDSDQYLIPYLIKKIKEYNQPIVCTGKIEMELPEECLVPLLPKSDWKKTIVLGDEKWYLIGEKWLANRNAWQEWWGKEVLLYDGITNQHELFGEALQYFNIKKIHLCDELKDKFTTEMLENILANQYYNETGDILANFDDFGVLRFFSMMYCKKIWILAHASWAAHPYLQFAFQTFVMPINMKVEWDVVRLGFYWDFFLWVVETKQMGVNRENVSHMLWSMQSHITPQVRDHALNWAHFYLRTKYPEEYMSKNLSYCYIENPDDLAHVAKCMILWYETPYYYGQVNYPQLIDLNLNF